ncbi:hypothetical protein A7J05_02915 [Streptomyces alfalfae]|uniref:Uncharacterized protein n=1 Tax=Streptomyces alfalfae TaxID=1642299 RepID=A0ABM6GLS6_9ACTN|nr:hypothetical protein A7J05_02915 [Streptomyces alfalfae]
MRRALESVFGWDRAEDDGAFAFRDTFGHLYDWHGRDTLHYDDFDPEHRIARSVAEYESIRTSTVRHGCVPCWCPRGRGCWMPDAAPAGS